MTTNNHSAQGPVSLDRLRQIREILCKAAAQSDGGNLGYAMADAVKVIGEVLERRNADSAEPVLYVMQGDGIDFGECASTRLAVIDDLVDEWNENKEPDVPLYKTVTLYAATHPAPVVPEIKCDDDGTTTSEFDHGWNACRAAMLQGTDGKPELTVWYGSMPETNGKTNWTAMLHRKGQHQWEGITIDRSEYPDRVRYEADRMRHLIGELPDEPDILSYDADAHSGYVKPGNSPASPDGWQLVPKKITLEMECAISRADSYEIGWQWALAAAPKYEVKS